MMKRFLEYLVIALLVVMSFLPADAADYKGGLEANESLLLPELGSTPANPAAGKRKVYFKTDGVAYNLNSSGVENTINPINENLVINGGMRIAQRGASFTAATTPSNNDDTYTLDRFVLLSDGNDIVDVTQATDVPTGALNSIGLDVETIQKKFGILTILEQKDAIEVIGGTVSLSFKARVTDITKLDNIKAAVLAWDGMADTVTSDVVSAWNAADTTPTFATNWTAENTPANLNVTASWAKYKIENISIDTASAKNVAVFIWSDAVADNDTLGTFLYVTQVKLEAGPLATPFRQRHFARELALGQRYFCKTYNQGSRPGTATPFGLISFGIDQLSAGTHNARGHWSFPTAMRKTPTITFYDSAGTSGKWDNHAGAGATATVLANTGNENTVTLVVSTSPGATDARVLGHITADAEL